MVLCIFRRVWLLLPFFLLVLSACDDQGKEKRYSLHYSDAIMGTSFTIKVLSIPGSLTSDELKFQIKSLLDILNGQMSTYLQDSELSKFNKIQSTEWQTVSESLYLVLEEAKSISDLSNGAFDITVGPLVNLWGFGPDSISFNAPDNKDIEAQLKKIGSSLLQLENNSFRIKKNIPQLYLDLSAIAKGYAVDQVADLLINHGVTDYMVEIGGELRLKGNNLYGKPWRIAIEKPITESRIVQKVLPLTNISLATSGDYRNFFEVDNVRFSHTIDPRSGRPITHKLASITILSDTTMKADALATTLMVLGPEQGYIMAEKEKIAALFIIKTDDGFIEKASSTFLEKLK